MSHNEKASRSGASLASTMRYLVVNADDFGYSRSVNRGVIEAHERGIVTSTSLMVDRPGAAEAADYASSRPDLGLGLHVELKRWRVSRMPRRGAAFRASALARATSVQLRRQLERFRALAGRDPSHLDAHYNRHLSADVRPQFQALADELSIPLRRVDPRIAFRGEFYGQDGKGSPDPEAITPEALVRVLESIHDPITDLACHPGFVDDLDDWYRTEREQEVRALCDERVRGAVSRLGLELSTFSAALRLSGEDASR
jgi:chitin disaccharide deacetylase